MASSANEDMFFAADGTFLVLPATMLETDSSAGADLEPDRRMTICEMPLEHVGQDVGPQPSPTIVVTAPGQDPVPIDDQPDEISDDDSSTFSEILAARQRQVSINLAKRRKAREENDGRQLEDNDSFSATASSVSPGYLRTSLSGTQPTGSTSAAADNSKATSSKDFNLLQRSASVFSRRAKQDARSSGLGKEGSGLSRRASNRLSYLSPSNFLRSNFSGYPSPHSDSSTDDNMSPLANKFKRFKKSKPLTGQDKPEALRIRDSTFEPAGFDNIPDLSSADDPTSSSEAASSPTPEPSTTDIKGKQPVRDYGTFRTGVPQFSHTHWDSTNFARVSSSGTTESGDHFSIDPDSLRADASSVRGEIHSNASSASLNSTTSVVTAQRIPTGRIINPERTSDEAGDQSVQDTPTKPSTSTRGPSLLEGLTHMNYDDDDVASVKVSKQRTSSETIIRSKSTSGASTRRGFRRLIQNPSPVPVGHPIHSTDPFLATSDAPLLSTPSTPAEVRRILQAQGKANNAPQIAPPISRPSTSGRGVPKNNILNVLRRQTNPDQEISLLEAVFFGPDDPSQTEPATPGRKSLSGTSSTKRSVSEGFRSLVRRRSSAGATDSDRQQFSAERFKNDREHYLRAVTNTLPRPHLNMFPNHPNTGKPWSHRNLRCTDCKENFCFKCGHACCAYKAAQKGTHSHKGPSAARARGHLAEIERFRPYGQELPVFMKCIECEEEFCPDCLGQCCDQRCLAVHCRDCKSDPWVLCDFHVEHS